MNVAELHTHYTLIIGCYMARSRRPVCVRMRECELGIDNQPENLSVDGTSKVDRNRACVISYAPSHTKALNGWDIFNL